MQGCLCAASRTEPHVTPAPMQRWQWNPYPGAVVFRGRLVVRREDHDLVAGGAQPLDEALEAVLHAADVAEGAGLLPQFSRQTSNTNSNHAVTTAPPGSAPAWILACSTKATQHRSHWRCRALTRACHCWLKFISTKAPTAELQRRRCGEVPLSIFVRQRL